MKTQSLIDSKANSILYFEYSVFLSILYRILLIITTNSYSSVVTGNLILIVRMVIYKFSIII